MLLPKCYQIIAGSLFILAIVLAIYTTFGVNEERCSLQKSLGFRIEFYSFGYNVSGIVIILVIIMIAAIIYLLREKPFLARAVTLIVDSIFILMWISVSVFIMVQMSTVCIGLSISYLIYVIALVAVTIAINLTYTPVISYETSYFH